MAHWRHIGAEAAINPTGGKTEGRIPGTSAFVGRRDELAAFQSTLARLDQPSAIEVAGEPGIGKTRLLAEFVAEARHHQATVMSGRATQYEQTLPFGIFNDALGELMAQGNIVRPDGVTPDDWGLLRTAFPSLENAETTPGDATDRRHLYRAVRALLTGLATANHLVVVLDDLHWADPESADLLRYLLDHPPQVRLMMVMAYRPWQLPPRVVAALKSCGPKWMAGRLELGPLNRTDVDALLGPELSRSYRDGIYRQCAGNPFYLEAIRNTGALSLHEHPPAKPSTTTAELPWTVRMSLQAELDTLDTIPRLVAEAAAVTGDEVVPALLAAVAELPVVAVLDGLDTLKNRDILRPSGPGARFSFRHPVLRQTVYETSGAGWRLGAHQRAAAEMEAMGMSLAQRARHAERYAQPGDDGAVGLLVSAADAVQGHAPSAAAHWLDIALAMIPEGQDERRLLLLGRLAYTLGISGEYSRSLDKLSDILALLPCGAPGRTAAARIYAVLARLLGRTANARELLQGELDAIEPDDPGAPALRLELAHVCLTENWEDDGLRQAGTAYALSKKIGDRAQMAYAASTIALIRARSGGVDEANQHIDEAAGIVAGLPDGQLLGHLELFIPLPWACVTIERFDSGIVHLHRGLSLARSSGQDYLLPPMLTLLAYARAGLGNLAQARSHADEAAEAALISGTPMYRLLALAAQAMVADRAGDVEAVIAYGEEALRQPGETSDLLASQSLCDLSVALIGAGREKEGTEHLLRLGGGETLPQITVASRARSHEALVRGSLLMNDRGRALRHAHYASDIAAWLPLDGSKGYAQLALAQVMTANDPATAVRHAETAAGLFGRIGAVTEAARSKQLAAEIHDGTGWMLEGAQVNAGRRPTGTMSGITGPPPQDGPSPLAVLSPRQREVARLVADAYSNRQIARTLGIVERTVEAHVTQILRKLDLPSRAAIASAVTRSALTNCDT